MTKVSKQCCANIGIVFAGVVTFTTFIRMQFEDGFLYVFTWYCNRHTKGSLNRRWYQCVHVLNPFPLFFGNAVYAILRDVHALGMPGTFSPPWCMSGSLIRGNGENVLGIPGACASRNFTYLGRSPWKARCYVPNTPPHPHHHSPLLHMRLHDIGHM